MHVCWDKELSMFHFLRYRDNSHYVLVYLFSRVHWYLVHSCQLLYILDLLRYSYSNMSSTRADVELLEYEQRI